MKIKQVKIRNFQSHRETVVPFVDGVNAIVGDSDQGKSSILRAIRWCLFNVPGGEEFVSYWGGETAVELEFDNGLRVERYRGKGRNEYLLSIPGEKPQRFAGFGLGVPDIVKQALGFHEFNARFQHQGAFLLCENAGEVSRYLNRIAKLDVIDSTLTSLKASHAIEKGKANAEADNAKRLSEALKPFEFLDQAEVQLVALESQDEALRAKISEYNRLFDIWEEAGTISGELETASDVLRFTSDVEVLEVKERDIVARKARADALDRILSQMEEDVQQFVRIAGLTTVDLTGLFDKKLTLERKKLENHNLDRLWRAIEEAERDLVHAQNKVSELSGEYARAFPDVCPLCGAGGTTEKEVPYEAAGKTKPGTNPTTNRIPKRAAR